MLRTGGVVQVEVLCHLGGKHSRNSPGPAQSLGARPQPPEDVTARWSENVQRAHFCAFFRNRERLSLPWAAAFPPSSRCHRSRVSHSQTTETSPN